MFGLGIAKSCYINISPIDILKKDSPEFRFNGRDRLQ